MSARTVAVTRLLIDLLVNLDAQEHLPPSEGALVDLLYFDLDDLHRIHDMAVAEMQGLAPAMLAADAKPGVLA
jgi:hypothetical protein